MEIEHVGSTAVPGLATKPVIDIMPGVAQEAALSRCIRPLQQMSYTYVPEFEAELPSRRYFHKRGSAEEPAFHVHVVAVGRAFWVDHLLFRDYLRAHPASAQQYERLKRELASTVGDAEAYQDAKTAFIESILQRATQNQSATWRDCSR